MPRDKISKYVTKSRKMRLNLKLLMTLIIGEISGIMNNFAGKKTDIGFSETYTFLFG
jgi:hypothetical protein